MNSKYTYVTSAVLDPPVNGRLRPFRDLVAGTALTLGLLVTADNALQELSHPGYHQQATPRWTISSTPGLLVSNDPVEFPISWLDTKPKRLTLFSDGTLVASGDLYPGRSYLADLSGAKITFPRGEIGIRRW